MSSGSSQDLFQDESNIFSSASGNEKSYKIYFLLANRTCSLLISLLTSLTTTTSFIGYPNSAKCTLFWLETDS